MVSPLHMSLQFSIVTLNNVITLDVYTFIVRMIDNLN